MKLEITKYHGTGNDFLLIDDRKGRVAKNLNARIVRTLCTRRFGMGADGLILLQKHAKWDFKMKYYNADGKESTMCGNGARCLAHFARGLKVFRQNCVFEAIDGRHEAKVKGDLVELKMSDVSIINKEGKDWKLDTGSPHYIQFVNDLSSLDIVKKGRQIRNRKAFVKKGINVNFVRCNPRSIDVATYERGVEDETYSCGTGVVASAIASHYSQNIKSHQISITTKGGKLKVHFDKNEKGYHNVWLIGPAQKVYDATVEV